MYSFLICVVALILGYLFYGKFISKIFGADPSRVTPAISKNDGVDYVPMPTWKVFMIQFLNIAGTGPIFGAVMGAKFGPSAYLWIVLGCIFAGAVHDYLSGMMSIRHDGISLPDIVGRFLGKTPMNIMLVFCVLMLTLVGVVFVYTPAINLADIASFGIGSNSAMLIWVGVIFVYYVIATMLPIDKVIGRLYPIFAASLLFMALSLFVCLVAKWPTLPEFTRGLGNKGAEIGFTGQTIFPCLFITIACGAISGFHATQSPMMARCLKNEKFGRPIFYGAMITEGLVALIWAAVASYFFFDGGAAEVGSDISAAAPTVVTKVAQSWLGPVGAILAILGVVAAPITSGDTAFRGARLIVADFLGLDQTKRSHRLYIAIPLFVAALALLWYSLSQKDSFNVIWGYFGWANQTLACFVLWTETAFLLKRRKGLSWLITMIPAVFMTSVCVTFLFVSKLHLLSVEWTAPVAIATAVISVVVFFLLKRKVVSEVE